MYRATDLKTGLLNVVGMRQNYDVSDFVISDSLTTTDTGQYFQDFHPLITLANIKAIAPRFNAITYPAWDIATQYRIGDRVTNNSLSYRAKTDSIGLAPEINPTEWERFDPFSEWLEQKIQASILKGIQRFWSERMEDDAAKNIVESRVLFDGAGRMTDAINPTDSLAGFEVIPIRAKGVTLKIEKIGLQFNQAGTVRVYIIHASQTEPMQINGSAYVDLNYTKNGGMQWFAMTDLFLPYLSDDIDAGGSWFLCYDQRELPDGMKAINKNMDWSAQPCSTCSRSEYLNWQAWSRYLEIHPFKTSVDRGALNAGYFASLAMWDIADNVYTYTQSYGLNLQLTMQCDVTDIILEQKKAFQNVIGLQFACDIIREMAYNPSSRVSGSTLNYSKNELLYELDGDSQSEKKSGLMYDLKNSMRAINVDMTKMSRICFPCSNGGIKYRTT